MRVSSLKPKLVFVESNSAEPAYGGADWQDNKVTPTRFDLPLVMVVRVASVDIMTKRTNTGSETVRLAAWFSESPARVFLPSGDRLTPPWDS
jgi:hypothetical protein